MVRQASFSRLACGDLSFPGFLPRARAGGANDEVRADRRPENDLREREILA